MTLASYIRRECMVHMHLFMGGGGGFFACPVADWHATGREKLLTN